MCECGRSAPRARHPFLMRGFAGMVPPWQSLEHIQRLGVAAGSDAPYSKESAMRVMRGRPVDPSVRDAIHAKLSWILGVQLLSFLEKNFPAENWSSERVPVRTLADGEASASFLSFDDGSHAVLVSRALQENVIAMANLVEYFDMSSGNAKSLASFGKILRGKDKAVSRLSVALRYSLLGQRMTGWAPPVPVELDSESFDVAAKMASGALMFVVAHELGHIVLGHTTTATTPLEAGGSVTVSELQELQADNWAVAFLKAVMADDPEPENIVLWCAFIALWAMQVTEEAVFVRRNRTHPEAWTRWAVIEKQASADEDRTDRLRIGFMAGVLAASDLAKPFEARLWRLLWDDRLVSIPPNITETTLSQWDYANTAPISKLMRNVERDATTQGLQVLTLLRAGNVGGVLELLVRSARRRAALSSPSGALSFATLRGVFMNNEVALGHGGNSYFSVVAARLAANHLRQV